MLARAQSISRIPIGTPSDQTFTASDVVLAWRLIVNREDQHVAQPLMIPFFVIMRDELANRSA